MPTTDPAGLSPTLQLAFELLRRPSVTPDDLGCQALMIERLEALGFRVERLPFGATDGHKYVNGILDKLAGRLRSAEVAARRR